MNPQLNTAVEDARRQEFEQAAGCCTARGQHRRALAQLRRQRPSPAGESCCS